ncbi:hypothetical protein LTR17_018250 [Elasticomyces elasticus]|nr:hypothetical protein LTR17_018250 [Elasticomyces elasticus]
MIRILITTAALALLTSFTAATPVKRCMISNQQYCFITDKNDDGVTYTSHIGIVFANGKGCPGIYNAFTAKLGVDFSAYTCKDDTYGHTVISLTSQENRGNDINAVFNSMYPGVTGGFNCPWKDTSSKIALPPTGNHSIAARSLAPRCVRSNEQSCHMFDGDHEVLSLPKNWNTFMKYTDFIGVTFADGFGCPGIEKALLEKIGGALRDFTCQDDGYGHTKLSWTSPYNHGANVNEVLTGMYPMVAGGFNCPHPEYVEPDPIQHEKRSTSTIQ